LSYYSSFTYCFGSIYLRDCKEKNCNLLRPLIELWLEFHLLFMVFWIGGYRALNSKSFGLPVGETALAGSVVLAIMALPTIITISEDAMRNTRVP
jgi:phosphate transport system permease protein